MSKAVEDRILEFQPNAVENVRKLYGYNNQEEMDKAVHILEDWVKQQKHFKKKDISPEYLEGIIISSKGSIERAKTKIDKICTFRTLMPQYFGESDYKTDYDDIFSIVHHALLPKPTKDNERVFFLKNFGQQFNSKIIHHYFKAAFQIAEYIRVYDYSTSLICVLDYTETNLKELLANINLFDLQHCLSILIEAYGLRVKGMHIISQSKLIDLLITLLKQVLSKKLGERIQTHKTIETFYKFVPKEILPKEYGGEERSLTDLHDEWTNVLSSENFKNYLREVNKATTDENLRQKDSFNEQYMGIAGTFRTLTVD